MRQKLLLGLNGLPLLPAVYPAARLRTSTLPGEKLQKGTIKTDAPSRALLGRSGPCRAHP